ncbi:MAG: DNA polymerase III subunit alpha [Parachlamydiales bacterium]|jgi:DNA polymerase-3 subunit alpha
MSFVPLHVHSQYSILDSTLSLKEIVKKAKEEKFPAIALTDSGNLHGAVDFYKNCKNAELQAIIGCELKVAVGSRLEKKKQTAGPAAFPVVLLVKDKTGYQNLVRLSSLAFSEGFYYYPRIDRELLARYHEGLICLIGSYGSLLARFFYRKEEEAFSEELLFYQNLFQGDLFFELQRHQMTEERLIKEGLKKEAWVLQKYLDFASKEELLLKKLVEVGKEKQIKCLATLDAHYLKPEDWRAHEILLNIQSGEPCEIWEKDRRGMNKGRQPNPKRKIYPSHSFHFPGLEELQKLFSDLPEALENTAEVASRCHFHFDFKTKHYPVFVPPVFEAENQREGLDPSSAYLYHLCRENLAGRYGEKELQAIRRKHPNRDPGEMVQKRLEEEFLLISSKGLSDYLLIVHDFISWSKGRRIPMGPGRGSVVGSLIAYLIGITEIEPLRFNLFFERFINPERVSYPDIDVDICMERRSEVIDYTIKKYGQQNVAQIITFGTMKAKMAIKDVGRVLSVPLSKVNEMAKLVSDDPNMQLEKALRLDPELKRLCEEDSEAKMIFDAAKTIEGSIRNTSLHAAGVIISAVPVIDKVPVCTAKDAEMLVTQYAMKPVEAVGMLKIDFLGLKTLTSLQKAANLVEKSCGKKINWAGLPLDDARTFDLLNHGRTLGVFQVESGGMQELCKQLHIDRFEELIAVLSLYRPGPMDMIPSFVARKHKREPIEFDHPLMKDILEETYGVMVYQEQVMQIASLLAGYSLGEGDVLRRAMGKKDRQEMEKQREKFVLGCRNNKISQEAAVSIFDKIEKFASYGFNKSHATAYAYLSYATAYFKANFPKEWMAALMTCDRDDLTKVAKFISEAKELGISILPPDINEASAEFTVTSDGIRFAMSGIKGMGGGVVEAICREREKKGAFVSFYDFIVRIDKKQVGKKNIELLVDAGAFDFTGWSRDAMRQGLEKMYEGALKQETERKKGVLSLFQTAAEPQEPRVEKPTSDLEILQKEKALLGFYLKCHPMDSFHRVLPRLSCTPFADLEKIEGEKLLRLAFAVEQIKIKVSQKNQKKFAILTISDGLHSAEMPLWSDVYERSHDLLKENQLLLAIVLAEKKDSLKLNCKWIAPLETPLEILIKESDLAFDKLKSTKMTSFKRTAKNMETKALYKKITLYLDVKTLKMSHLLEIKKICLEHPGPAQIELVFCEGENRAAEVQAEAALGLRADETSLALLKRIRALKKLACS